MRGAAMFHYEALKFRYDPYPIGFTEGLITAELYQQLADNFPSPEGLRQASSMGDNKFLLTEFDGPRYFGIIDSHLAWRTLYDYVKSPDFVRATLSALCSAHIDQGLRTLPVVSDSHYQGRLQRYAGTASRLLDLLRAAGRSPGHLTSRFEFSALRGQVASHLPHTDAPRKVISLVISMMKPGEWDPAWGGGTAVCKPLDMRKSFNYLNQYMPFEDVEVVETYPFLPNGCVLFVKTFNSWHTVMPYQAPPEMVRKSIVVNIDYPQALGAG